MPSYPRASRVAQVFVPNQTFEGFITFIAGDGEHINVRPIKREGPNGTTVCGWEQQIAGEWIVTADREFA